MAAINKSKTVGVRFTPGDYRRLFAVARKLADKDEATVSDLLRDVVKKGILGGPKERAEFYAWMLARLDHLETKQRMLELGLVRPARAKLGAQEGAAADEGRLTKGAV